MVLPELFGTGYRVEEQDRGLAELVPGSITNWMCRLAKKYGAYLIGAVIEDGGEGILYDTAVMAGPRGFWGSTVKCTCGGMKAGALAGGRIFALSACPLGR